MKKEYIKPRVQDIDVASETTILLTGSNEPDPRNKLWYEEDDEAEEQYGVL